MNYYNFIKQIKNISLSNGIVNEVGEGDIYQHLNSGMHKYPCVFLTVQNVTFTNDIVNVNATLFYVDRLLDNSSNKLEIQSNGITVLSQILDRIAEETVINTVQNVYTPFEEKFADLCAGQFVTFRASFPNDVICSDDEFEIKTITLNHNGIYDIIGYDKAVVAVEGGVWGQITGDINEQTDLIELVDGAVGDSCECVQEAKTEILDAIGKIDIDTTELAKQGTDENANITDITEKLQQIIGANILQPNLQGITFADGYATDNAVQLVLNRKNYIKTIESDISGSIQSGTFYGNTYLTDVNLPNITGIGESAFFGCSNLTEVDFPNVVNVYQTAFRACSRLSKAFFPKMTVLYTLAFYSCTNLRYLDISGLMGVSGTSGGALQACPNLIDIHMGRNITTNLNLASGSIIWNPTNAYLNTTNNLVPADVRAEHPEWTNRDYLLYCLREHFAANLPDRTGQSSLTITFNGTMKTHINNSPETAAAFTNKNYIIA